MSSAERNTNDPRATSQLDLTPPEATSSRSAPQGRGGNSGEKLRRRKTTAPTPTTPTTPTAQDAAPSPATTPGAQRSGVRARPASEVLASTATTTSQPPTRPFSVTKAKDLLAKPDVSIGNAPLPQFRVEANVPRYLRFVSNLVVTVKAHWYKEAGQNVLRTCNGTGCVFCLALVKAIDQCLVPVFDIDNLELAVLAFGLGGDKSLASKILPLLERDEYLDLVVEVTRERSEDDRGAGRYVVDAFGRDALAQSDLSNMDLGDDVLREIVEGEPPPPDVIAAIVEQSSNEQLLQEFPALARKVRLRDRSYATRR